MRETCWLDEMMIMLFIEPISDIVSLIAKIMVFLKEFEPSQS